MKLYCGSIAALMFLLVCGSSRGAALEEYFEQTYPIDPDARITVRNLDGRIRIYGSSKPEIHVRAVKRAFTRERLRRIAIEITAAGKAVSIETVFPENPPASSLFADRSGTVDYLLLIPEGSTLAEVQLKTGEVVIEGMHGGPVNGALENGKMTVLNCFADTTVAVGRGRLDIGYQWWEDRVRFAVDGKIGAGLVTAALPPDAVVRISADAGAGTARSGFNGKDDNPGIQQAFEQQLGEGPAVRLRIQGGKADIRIVPIY